jgi:hypothetical protein
MQYPELRSQASYTEARPLNNDPERRLDVINKRVEGLNNLLSSLVESVEGFLDELTGPSAPNVDPSKSVDALRSNNRIDLLAANLVHYEALLVRLTNIDSRVRRI